MPTCTHESPPIAAYEISMQLDSFVVGKILQLASDDCSAGAYLDRLQTILSARQKLHKELQRIIEA